MKLPDLVVVTTSKNKLSEINEILRTSHKVSTINIPEIQSLDLNEVITHKAKEAYNKIKKPVKKIKSIKKKAIVKTTHVKDAEAEKIPKEIAAIEKAIIRKI